MASSKQINLDDIKKTLDENIIAWKEIKSLIIKKLKEYLIIHKELYEASRVQKKEIMEIHARGKRILKEQIEEKIDELSKVIRKYGNDLFEQLKITPELKDNRKYNRILDKIAEIDTKYTKFNNETRTKIQNIDIGIIRDVYGLYGGYYSKYMKYKAKYLQLKSKL